jgi:AcrR family transcriptional regulator
VGTKRTKMTEQEPYLIDILFDGDGGTREEILAATFKALHEHGYSELTVDDIGDEFEKSQSLIYHHYDSKDEVLLDLLELMIEHFESHKPGTYVSDPRDRIKTFVEMSVGLESMDRTAAGTFTELRAQAIHDDDYREQFVKYDEVIQEALADDIRKGIEAGAFRDVDAERMATWLYTVTVGTTFRSVTAGDSWIDMNEEEVNSHLENVLYR